jgi:hypothetical protein
VASGKGFDAIPLRIPEKWDAQWFLSFVKDVLALGDVRNADSGPGISVASTTDGTATISGNADIGEIADGNFVLAEPSAGLANGRVLDAENGVLAVEDHGAGGAIRIVVIDNGIYSTKLRKSPALTVMGVPSDTPAEQNVQDIPALLNDRILRRVADALDFGLLTLGMAPAGLWTFAKLQSITTDRWLGRTTAGSGDIEELTPTQGLDMIGATPGTILYRGASDWLPLVPASNGDLLTLTAGVPAWVTPTVGPIIASGTYTPTATIIGASTSTATPSAAQWSRVGNTVTVSGVLAIGSTISSNVEVELTLPVASNFASQEQCAGNGTGVSADMRFRIGASGANDKASFKSQTVGAGVSTDVFYSYTYQVTP